MCNIYITGLGIISAIGNNVSETLVSLKAKKTGIKPIQYLNTVHKNEFVVGEVAYSNEELAKISGIIDYKKHSRSTLLALIAAKQAFENSNIDINDGLKTGIISASTVGGMDITEDTYRLESSTENNNFIFIHYVSNHVDEICKTLNINDFSATISTACSSSANAIMNGARMIKAGRLDRVIVGGTDALSKFTLNGFNTLMILDKELCSPFDENRRGLNLGEGAAYLVLESEKAVKKYNKKIYGKVLGYANANDAYHQTASSPEGNGATLAMKQAIASAKITPNQISYINVHGTGTTNNDDSEGAALQNIYGDKVPPFSSTKSYTGHTLAAAGSIEAVFSILSINNNLIFPNINLKNKIEKFNFKPETEIIDNKDISVVLSNSFGFGGNNTTLIFGKNNWKWKIYL